MHLAFEFEATQTWGIESPNNTREFVKPPIMMHTSASFVWAIDSHGIIWITDTSASSPNILCSPCRTYCLNMIKSNHPYIDINYVNRAAQSVKVTENPGYDTFRKEGGRFGE